MNEELGFSLADEIKIFQIGTKHFPSHEMKVNFDHFIQFISEELNKNYENERACGGTIKI